MDIASLSMAMSQQNVGMQLSTALTKMVLDTQEISADVMTDMMKSMELSVNPNLGSNIDVLL
ncbi:MAG: hypothetical protein ATN36_01320 [Epulopiscium sp. Nele67-Bin005]|nr:MAG: hypothetical protein ATN36_01320 [Epulopiscium sp. Nele67-Bin005]